MRSHRWARARRAAVTGPPDAIIAESSAVARAVPCAWDGEGGVDAPFGT